MKKLKPIVYELVSLKKELLDESHSKTVKQALELTIDQMLKNGFIDLDIQLYLKDSKFSEEELYSYLESNDVFKKTKEELEIEYSNFIETINDSMERLGMSKGEFYCKADVDNEKIKICKVYSLREEFLKSFFYFKDDSGDYLEKLMKRKGFIERFAILRLPRIFFNFIDAHDKNENFTLEKTYPYFDSKNHCYSIDLVFDLEIDSLIEESSRDNILNEVIDTMNCSEKYFEEKMSI